MKINLFGLNNDHWGYVLPQDQVKINIPLPFLSSILEPRAQTFWSNFTSELNILRTGSKERTYTSGQFRRQRRSDVEKALKNGRIFRRSSKKCRNFDVRRWFDVESSVIYHQFFIRRRKNVAKNVEKSIRRRVDEAGIFDVVSKKRWRKRKNISTAGASLKTLKI